MSQAAEASQARPQRPSQQARARAPRCAGRAGQSQLQRRTPQPRERQQEHGWSTLKAAWTERRWSHSDCQRRADPRSPAALHQSTGPRGATTAAGARPQQRSCAAFRHYPAPPRPPVSQGRCSGAANQANPSGQAPRSAEHANTSCQWRSTHPRSLHADPHSVRLQASGRRRGSTPRRREASLQHAKRPSERLLMLPEVMPKRVARNCGHSDNGKENQGKRPTRQREEREHATRLAGASAKSAPASGAARVESAAP